MKNILKKTIAILGIMGISVISSALPPKKNLNDKQKININQSKNSPKANEAKKNKIFIKHPIIKEVILPKKKGKTK